MLIFKTKRSLTVKRNLRMKHGRQKSLRRAERSQKADAKKGFTLVETALSTALIAVLLIAVAVIIINIVSIYRKGMTLRALNSVGRTLVEDLNTTIEASSPTEILDSSSASGTTSSARDFYTYYYRNYPAPSDVYTSYGAFCTGTYSYIWQTYTDKTNSLTIQYRNAAGQTVGISGFHLLKIRDVNQMVCSELTSNDVSPLILSNAEDATDENTYIISQTPEELLADTDLNLVVYDLTVSPVNSNANLNQDLDTLSTETFFSGTITLGTTTDLENATNNGVSSTVRLDSEACAVSRVAGGLDGGVTDFDYCAVNRFKFAARAGSGI